ncbi:hypothetical protein S40288_02258 [Stachybotrys chartarum IBT 40288]|nr:hypothetical protein S40288_02258 [Stachybotrys chartarum IBT 40288]
MTALPYVHPSLATGVAPSKGRLVTATVPIRNGETVMIDRPYALVPAVMADEPSYQLCSGHDCNRRLPSDSDKATCSQNCAEEVIWCNEECRIRDEARHKLECSWLQETATSIRSTHGESEFGLLWLIARIMIAKHLNLGEEDLSPSVSVRPKNEISTVHFGRRGWDAVENLEGGHHSFPSMQVEQWKDLTRQYLITETLSVGASVEEFVTLICKVETNSFGLYPGITGEYPIVSYLTRGDYYGGGIYPTAAMFNHACCPNITHELDQFSRRIFKAGRDIAAGEECCIAYFDLVEFVDTEARRTEVSRSWAFACGCQRCIEEGGFDLPHYLKEMNFGFVE